MKVGDLVMLIGREPDMPKIGSIGEIVGPLDRGDFDVDFPGIPCQAGPGTSWCVPPQWLMRIPPGDPDRNAWSMSWDEIV